LRRAGRAELADALVEALDSTWRVAAAADVPPTDPRAAGTTTAAWTIGHCLAFVEQACLERPASGRPAAAERLLDPIPAGCAALPHDALPPLEAMQAWRRTVVDDMLAGLARAPSDPVGLQPFRLALAHTWLHLEAIGETLHALGLPGPQEGWPPPAAMTLRRDVRLPAGTQMLGAAPDDGFAFDVERDAHPVRLEPFEISLEPVTVSEYLQFVEDGGYRRPEFWQGDAFQRHASVGRFAPRDWRRIGDRWQVRWFDRWLPATPYAPVARIDFDEASAWCVWAGRRLPSEAEWEAGATRIDDFDWGDSVWEWTDSVPRPYPGHSPAAWRRQALPWHDPGYRVVRGGSSATSRGLPDPRLRRFERTDRADLMVGFRSCALR
jgi:iron(II)-dependent oxidoreductase